MWVCVGLPSVPMIVNVVGGAGVATITVTVNQFGVNTAADFTLILSIFNNSQSVIPESIRTTLGQECFTLLQTHLVV